MCPNGPKRTNFDLAPTPSLPALPPASAIKNSYHFITDLATTKLKSPPARVTRTRTRKPKAPHEPRATRHELVIFFSRRFYVRLRGVGGNIHDGRLGRHWGLPCGFSMFMFRHCIPCTWACVEPWPWNGITLFWKNEYSLFYIPFVLMTYR
ncbi:hypothetical protein L208DRAFT_784263 [Tricholoma matsutake]|nr:hypothetical protein L208DRAFT_784263 [Tricholoma matsutake 945]